eukprot:SAG31_NODE_1951_length_6831_cov_2.867053_1_plen_63_part_00
MIHVEHCAALPATVCGWLFTKFKFKFNIPGVRRRLLVAWAVREPAVQSIESSRKKWSSGAPQ